MEVESAGDMYIDYGNKMVGIVPTKKKKWNLFIYTLIMDKEIIFKLLSWYADRSEKAKGCIKHIVMSSHNPIIALEAIQSWFNRHNKWKLFTSLKVYTYEFKGYVTPVNNLKEHKKASRDLFKQDVIKEVLFGERRIHTKIHDTLPVKYGENAKVSSSIIGTYTKVFGEVKNNIIFKASIIEEDTNLDNCVIMQVTVIKKGSKLSNVILEKFSIIGKGDDYHGRVKKALIKTGCKINIWIMKKKSTVLYIWRESIY